MNIKVTQYLLILSIIFLASGSLQSQTGNWNVLVPDNNMLVGNDIFLEGNEKGIEGTPLLFDTWLKGYIELINESKLEGIRINLLNQDGELFVSKPYEGLDVKYHVDEKMISHFVVIDSLSGEERRFDYLRSDQVQQSKNKAYFYEVLTDGKYQLIKLAQKEFLQAEQEKAYAIGEQKSRYILEVVYYFRSDASAKYTPLKLRKKDLQSVLGSSQSQKLKSLIKSNRWSWSKEQDVVQLLKALE